MITYLDRVLVLHPGIQHVMYWGSRYDGTPWNDPYEGLVWNNKDIPMPSKAELDAVTDQMVLDAKEGNRKKERDAISKQNLSLVASYNIEKKTNPDLSFSDFLDSLEVSVVQ
jgi:hypothetical protein